MCPKWCVISECSWVAITIKSIIGVCVFVGRIVGPAAAVDLPVVELFDIGLDVQQGGTIQYIYVLNLQPVS